MGPTPVGLVGPYKEEEFGHRDCIKRMPHEDGGGDGVILLQDEGRKVVPGPPEARDSPQKEPTLITPVRW